MDIKNFPRFSNLERAEISIRNFKLAYKDIIRYLKGEENLQGIDKKMYRELVPDDIEWLFEIMVRSITTLKECAYYKYRDKPDDTHEQYDNDQYLKWLENENYHEKMVNLIKKSNELRGDELENFYKEHPEIDLRIKLKK